ncbi:MAG: anthranilate synthase component I family protein [Paenibacillaceae bacterium]|nr:anthranilate synthase component I family protein [Paenibacillaceae bacterium]
MNDTVTREEWHAWICSGAQSLPMVAVRAYASPLPSWRALCPVEGHPFCVLESGKDGRYTIVTACCGDVFVRHEATEAVWDDLRAWRRVCASPRKDGWPPFVGGVIGYVAYDAARTIERWPARLPRAHTLPDVWFVRVRDAWIVDADAGVVYCVHHTDALEGLGAFDRACVRVQEMAQMWDRACAEKRTTLPDRTEFVCPEIGSRTAFAQAVHTVQSHIRAGEAYQVNVCLHAQTELLCAPMEVYERLRIRNPAPYMAYAVLNAQQAIVSASPECLVSCRGRTMTTKPIAGTRPRGADKHADEDFEHQLCSSEKQRAEHVMLVDLERNDIGKVAAIGTVCVPQLMEVERYAHVMHLVSTVQGTMRDGCDGIDVLCAMVPGGTITGAPKVRVMHIIEEVEEVRRGVYTGALGWIDDSGDLSFNIVIRTIVCDHGVAHVQAGAGIVLDSDADDEYDEIAYKAAALWHALACGGAHEADKQEAYK